ncbi:MAG: preprotein translocase subunit SecY [Planctomycetes bacterium]|nr:preprotein translocase subunit SecY [Planctomycetota bacterium]
MLGSLRNIFKVPELRRRILFTLALLAVFRLGCLIPVPGIDTTAITKEMSRASEGALGALFGMANLFTGGAFRRMALFGLGVMPYISASIIIQLLTTSVPYLEALSKEGDAGRKKIRRIERYLTLALCLFQGFVMVKMIEKLGGSTGTGGAGWVSEGVQLWQFEVMAVLGLTTGSIFLMWLGEQMSEYGIGNGISLIIMGGIVARAPAAVGRVLLNVDWKLEGGTGKMGIITILVLAALFVGIVVGVVIITQGQRRIPMQQAKQTRGRRVYGGQRHYMPLRVNQAGVIPIIFASSLLMFPSMIARGLQGSFPRMATLLGAFTDGRGFLYVLLYAALIIFFCFFWTAVTFNPQQMSENLRDYGSFIPGVRPGRRTAEYLERVMTRVTLAGAVFLSIIAVVPTLLGGSTGLDPMAASFFGGTGLLIVVGVALDLVERIETHLLMRHYDGFMRKGRIRGRR